MRERKEERDDAEKGERESIPASQGLHEFFGPGLCNATKVVTSSSLVMPMPSSDMVNVFASLSALMRTYVDQKSNKKRMPI